MSTSASTPSPVSPQNPLFTSSGSNPILEASRAKSDEIIAKTRIKHSHAIVYALVENQRGVLHRVSSMFRAKGFNITSIAIGRTSHPELARMTIVPAGDEVTLGLLVKQLRKMIDVVEVGVMTRQDSIARELALVRFETKSLEDRRAILDLLAQLGAARAADITEHSLVVEFCSTPEGIDSFIEEASKIGLVKEVVRTGLTALKKE